jgi:hypothetical protein
MAEKLKSKRQVGNSFEPIPHSTHSLTHLHDTAGCRDQRAQPRAEELRREKRRHGRQHRRHRTEEDSRAKRAELQSGSVHLCGQRLQEE